MGEWCAGMEDGYVGVCVMVLAGWREGVQPRKSKDCTAGLARPCHV